MAAEVIALVPWIAHMAFKGTSTRTAIVTYSIYM